MSDASRGLPRAVGLVAAALPWLAGALWATRGMTRALDAVAAVGAPDKLALFAEGVSEAQRARALGAGVTAALCVVLVLVSLVRARQDPSRAPVASAGVLGFGLALGAALVATGLARELGGLATQTAADPLALALAGSALMQAGLVAGAALAAVGALTIVGAAVLVKNARPLPVLLATATFAVPFAVDRASVASAVDVAAQVPRPALVDGIEPCHLDAGEHPKSALVAVSAAVDVREDTPLLVDARTPPPVLADLFAKAHAAHVAALTIAAVRHADPARTGSLSDVARAFVVVDQPLTLRAPICTGAADEHRYALDAASSAQRLVDALGDGACVAP